MEHNFRLYWRRETGCDAGTRVGLEDLDPAIRPRVLELAGETLPSGTPPAGEETIDIRLPFLDGREWRRRSESLRGISLVREGRVIRHVPVNAAAALRDLAADAVGGHPAWLAAPVARERGYFRIWRGVSVGLQEFLRRAVSEIYFHDAAAYEDRAAAWPLLVYQALRPCRGVPETEFTYDIADSEMLAEALRMVRRRLQEILGTAQIRIAGSGRAELSRRYAPIWHEDILRAVQAKPRRLLAVLGDEAMLVDAVITLGTARDLGMVKPIVRRVMTTLRSFYDRDMRELAAPLIAEATRALEEALEAASKQRLTKTAPGAISSLQQAARDRPFAGAGTYGHYKPGSAAFR